jgi:hypothetical protein
MSFIYQKTTSMPIFVLVTSISLITAAGLASASLAPKSSAKTDQSTSLKKFFDCVTKAAKNGTPSRLDVENCYDKTYSSGGVSSSASAASNGASAAASAG